MDLVRHRKTPDRIEKISIPQFPYDGNYLKKKGMKEGLLMGKTLKLLENEWVDNNFKISNEFVTKIIRDQNN